MTTLYTLIASAREALDLLEQALPDTEDVGGWDLRVETDCTGTHIVLPPETVRALEAIGADLLPWQGRVWYGRRYPQAHYGVTLATGVEAYVIIRAEDCDRLGLTLPEEVTP